MAGILEHYGDPEAVFAASRSSLQQCGLSRAQVDSLCDKRLEDADRLMEDCAKRDIHMITLGDSSYPSRLSNIYDPPLVLYWYGRQPAWNARPMISIVGSRKARSYGQLMASRLAASLTASGFLVVSGMASGVDGAANKAALLAGGTIAVLGCGVDVCFPLENRALYDDLRLAGTLVSEYPPDTQPASWRFPRRNRIISGLSVATIVIEAPERSGALITARLALEQGRDVYAVPGRLDDRLSAGCNALIRDHAADLITDPLQLLHAYGSLLPDPPDEARAMRLFHGQAIGSPPPGQRSRGPAERPAQPGRRPAPPAKPPAPAVRPQAGPPDPVPEKAKKPAFPAGSLWPKIKAREARGDERIRQQAASPDTPLPLPDHLSADERLVLEAVRAGARSSDQLIDATGMPAGKLLSLVTMLELDGLLVNHGGMITLC